MWIGVSDHPPTVIPAAPYRPSRVSGNPGVSWRLLPAGITNPFPLILNLLKDGTPAISPYVIPSVAEESKGLVRSQGRAFQIPRLRSE